MKRWAGLLLVVMFLLPLPGHAQSPREAEQLIRVGVGAFRDGLLDIAEKNFSTLVNRYPSHRKVHDVAYLLGKTYLVHGKLREARWAFGKILQEKKDFENADYALFWAAHIETRLGNPEEARRMLLSLTRRFSKFGWIDYAYYLLGLLDIGENRLITAKSFFSLIPQMSKNQELARTSLFWMGVLAYKRNDFEVAVRYFQSLWNEPRSVPPGVLNISLFWLGEAQFKLGRFVEARQNYQLYCDRVGNDPSRSEAYWRVGFSDYRMGKAQAAAEILEHHRQEFKDSRLFLYTHYLLGEILLLQGDHLSSLKEFASILQTPQGAALWGVSLLAQYWNHIQLGAFGDASRASQRLTKLTPFEEEQHLLQWLHAELLLSEGKVTDALPYLFNLLKSRFREKALFDIGRGYFFENKLREAVTNLEILFLEFPNSPHLEEGLFIKGECLTRLDDLDRALETYALLAEQKKPSVWQLLALTQLGNLHLFRNEIEKAERAFKRVVDLFPDHPLHVHAAFQLGNLLVKRKNIGEAVQYYSLVLRGNVMELMGETHFRLGEVFYQQEKYDKAFVSFETAMQHVKENSLWFFLTLFEMGNLQRRWDRFDDARKSYRTILDHSKDEELSTAARQLLQGMESRNRPSPSR